MDAGVRGSGCKIGRGAPKNKLFGREGARCGGIGTHFKLRYMLNANAPPRMTLSGARSSLLWRG